VRLHSGPKTRDAISVDVATTTKDRAGARRQLLDLINELRI
jgi:hypothetical protein